MSKERLFQLAAKADKQLKCFDTVPDDTDPNTGLKNVAKTAATLGAGAGGVLAYQNRQAIGDWGKATYAGAKPGIDDAMGKVGAFAGTVGQQAKDAAAAAAVAAKKKVGGFMGKIGAKLVGTAETALTVAGVERLVQLAARIEDLRDFGGGYSDAHVTKYYDGETNEVKKGARLDKAPGGGAMLKRNAGTLAGTAVGAGAALALAKKFGISSKAAKKLTAGGGGIGFLAGDKIDKGRAKRQADKMLRRKNATDSKGELLNRRDPRTYAEA